MICLVKDLSERGELLSALQGGRAGSQGMEVKGIQEERKSWQGRENHREKDLGQIQIKLDWGNYGMTLED